MSFSVTFFGQPDAIKRALARESSNLSGQSKEEFDAVLPAIETIIDQNVSSKGMMLKVQANGHATFTGEGASRVKTYGNVSVHIEPTTGILVE